MFKRVSVTVLLFLIALGSVWSLFDSRLFWVHDYLHAARLAELLRALQDGQLPAVWSGNLGYGYGMPLFLFYAPLPSYVGALLWWAGIPVTVAVKALFWIPTVIGLVGAFLLGRKWFGATGGLVLAAAFTLFPYRAVNLFVRGAVSESWGIMAIPWLLYAHMVLLDKKSKEPWWLVTAWLCVLVLSHNLTAVMVVPLCILATVFFAVQKTVRDGMNTQWLLKKVRLFAVSYLVAVGLTAFYTLPAVLENKYTQIASILSGYFDYHQHFVYIRQFFTPFWGYGGSSWGPEDGISFFLGYGQVLGLLLLGVMLLVRFMRVVYTVFMAKKSKDVFKELPVVLKQSSTAKLFSGLLFLGVGMFMAIGRSVGVWEAVPFLGTLQFPWRWLSVVAMGSAIVCAYVVSQVDGWVRRWVVAVLWLGLLGVNSAYFRPERFVVANEDIYSVDPDFIQRETSQILPDYLPKSFQPEQKQAKELYKDTFVNGSVSTLVNRSHQKLVGYKSETPGVITWSIADFPGWYAQIDGKPLAHTMNDEGLIVTQLPAGEHQVGVLFGRTQTRQVADSITFLTILGVAGWSFSTSKKRQQS